MKKTGRAFRRGKREKARERDAQLRALRGKYGITHKGRTVAVGCIGLRRGKAQRLSGLSALREALVEDSS